MNEPLPARRIQQLGNRQIALLISSSVATDLFCMSKENTELPTMSAAAYVRVSTEHRQFAISKQRCAIRKYAKHRGLEIIKEYSDGTKQPIER